MAESIWNWLTTFVLLAVVFLIILFAYYAKGTGLFTKIADEVLKFSNRFLPIEPRKELKQEEKLPQKVIDSQQEFVESVKSNLKKATEDKICRIGLDSILPLEDFGMELSNLDNNINSKITKEKGGGTFKSAEGYVALNKMTIENANVCIINPENFYNCYLSPKRECVGDMFNNVDIVRINNKEISTGIGKEKYQLARYMLKIDNNKFCFVPMHSGFMTRRGCDEKPKSLDKVCLNDIIREIPECGKKLEPEVLTEKDNSAISEFDRFVSFLNSLNSVSYNKVCRKTFFFNTKNIGSGYYIYVNPNRQIDLRFNKDGGKVIKRVNIVYIPYEIVSSDDSAKDFFNNYGFLKNTFIISPAGDYSTSDKSIAVVQDSSIIAFTDVNNKWILTKPNIYINKQPICAS